MWNVRTKETPVTITITISKSFAKYLSSVPGNYIKKLQKAAILGTTHLLREVQVQEKQHYR
jgi:trehalose-6-phosphatase